MNCEFCQGKCVPLHAVLCGGLTSTMHQCAGCFSCRVDPPFPEQSLHEYYANSYFQAVDWEVNKSALLAADYYMKIRPHLLRVPKGSSLDVGGGFGHFARYHACATQTSVDVVEPSFSCRSVLKAEQRAGDVFGALAEVPPGREYQNVFCFHVAEHLQELGGFLAQIRQRLLPGGQLFILSPNGASSTFREFGREWGWCCPEQHYQFLSDQIPDEYFRSRGFQVMAQQSVCPAVIHYPSRWLIKVHRHMLRLTGLVDSSRGLARLFLQSWRKLCWIVSLRLQQNRSNHSLCWFESFFAKRSGRSLDEVFLVLKRDA